MTYQQIAVSVDDHILTLTLNRPDKLNAYTPIMMAEMVDVLRKADKDDDVRAIIVTGAGRAFCAGADLSGGAETFDYAKRPERGQDAGTGGNINWSSPAMRDGGGRLTLQIYECLKPVIAAVNGPAVGIGATMQLPMDIRIASDTARFGFVFSRRGIVNEAASSWFLPRLVGVPQALAWCYSGEIFNAAEALRGGLVSEVVPPDQLLPRAREIARKFTEASAPVAVALIRQMMWRMVGADHPMEAHKIDSRAIYARGASADAKEGVTAFLEKREAKFSDRVSKDMPPFFPWWQERKYS